jgi:hypothetical protein
MPLYCPKNVLGDCEGCRHLYREPIIDKCHAVRPDKLIPLFDLMSPAEWREWQAKKIKKKITAEKR